MQKKPKDFWKSPTNQRQFMDDFAKKKGFTSLNDWNQVSHDQLVKNQGSGILKEYPSIFEALVNIYPEHEWSPFDRKQVPRNFWKSIDNQKRGMEVLSKQLGIKHLDEWKQVSYRKFQEAGGSRLLAQYKSLQELLKSIYPDHNWNTLDFASMPKNFWKSHCNQRLFLEHLENFHHIKLDAITYRQLIQLGGGRLVSLHPSMQDMFRTLFPERDWESAFSRVPFAFWNNEENVKKFLEDFQSTFQIHSIADWKRISSHQIRLAGGGGLLSKYGSVEKISEIVCPSSLTDTGNSERLEDGRGSKKRSEQRWLFLQVQKLFPEEEVIEEFQFQTTRDTGSHIEIDIYLPSLRIGFEYHGEHHYHDLPAFGPSELYFLRDKEKAKICKRHNIHLIPVPYWWDKTTESLKSLYEDYLQM